MSNQLSISCDWEGDSIRMAGWPSRDANFSNHKNTWEFSLKEELGAFRPPCAKILSPALPTQAKASALDALDIRELYHGSVQQPKKLCIRGEVQGLLQFLDKYKNSIVLFICPSWISWFMHSFSKHLCWGSLFRARDTMPDAHITPGSKKPAINWGDSPQTITK